MANAGEVFYLPPEPREPADKGARPHVVLGLPRPDIDTVTLAYASTRRNDAVFGAEHVLIDPFATRYRGTGLVRPTCVYPSRLVVWPLDEIRSRSPAGRIVDEMPEIRASLVRALGFGTGVTNEPNRTGTNRRGRVVELLPDVAAEWEVNHAAILTEPDYSRHEYQQTVVPLLDDSFEETSLDVTAADSSWLGTLQQAISYRNLRGATRRHRIPAHLDRPVSGRRCSG